MQSLRRLRTSPGRILIRSPLPDTTHRDQSQFALDNPTQPEQNSDDDARRREAMRDLLDSWMDRLQLISVITTFFASTEAGLLTITTRDSIDTPLSPLEKASNAGLLGALVVHSNAAIISFLAAFLLIRYKLRVAKSEQLETQEKEGLIASPVSTTIQHVENGTESRRVPLNPPLKTMTVSSEPPIWFSNPHLVQVGPFQAHPPAHLLGRCHSLCILLSALGFLLALMGIMCFAWARHPLSVSITSSVCMLLCIILGIAAITMPEASEGSRRSHVYYYEK